MRKDNSSLYWGMFLILAGVIFLLDLNGILPDRFYSEYINIILGVVAVVIYLKSKKLWILILGTFFFTNGLLIWIGAYTSRLTYLAAIPMIPGMIFFVVGLVKKSTMSMVPGAMLTSWGVYVLLVTANILNGFTMVMGMFFVFTALGFLIIFLYEQSAWAGIPSLVIGIIGLMILTIGMGGVARNMLLQILTIAMIVVGIGLVIRGLLVDKRKDNHKDKEG